MIIAGLQMRTCSVRLPGKALMKLQTHSIIEMIIKRLKTVKEIDKIYLLTTKLSSDDVLVDIAEKNSINTIRGSENDVLSRYKDLALMFPDSYIIRLTGDNPFFSMIAVRNLISIANCGEYDYIAVKKIPVGTNVEFIKTGTIVDIYTKDLSSEDKEHVTLYLKRSAVHNKLLLRLPELEHCLNIRLTLDTQGDFEYLSKLSSKLYLKYGEAFLYADLPQIFSVIENNCIN